MPALKLHTTMVARVQYMLHCSLKVCSLLRCLQLQEMLKCPAAHQATSSTMEKPWRAEMAEVVLAVGALEAYNAPAHQAISAVLPYSLFLPPGLGNISEALLEL